MKSLICERVSEVINKTPVIFSKKDWRLVEDIEEAMEYAENEKDTLALTFGVVIDERASDHTIERAVDSLKADPVFKDIDERDLTDFVKYFIKNHASSLVFAPEVVGSVIRFAQRIGFPTTIGGAESGNLDAPRYSAKTLLNVLVGAKVLTVVELDAEYVLEYAKQSSEEYRRFKADPKLRVDVYEWDPAFLKEMGHMLRQLQIKEEQITRSVQDYVTERQSYETDCEQKLEDLEDQISCLFTEDETDHNEGEGQKEDDFFLKISDDMVEEFIDGILMVLGKLEQNGDIPPIETPRQAKDAVIAAVRRMYQKRGLIAKLSTKYSRFGSKRELKKARQEIGKALT